MATLGTGQSGNPAPMWMAPVLAFAFAEHAPVTTQFHSVGAVNVKGLE